MSMLKKSSSKTPTQMLEKPVVEEEKPSPAPKKRSNEIDEIFSAKKRKKREQENSEKLKEDVSEIPKKKKKKKSKGAKDVGFVDPSPRPRKRTEDGLTIYAEEELGIGKADAGDMARLMVSKRRRRLFLMLDGVRCVLTTITMIVVLIYLHFCSQYRKRILRSPSYFTNEGRRIQLQNSIFHDDTTCINQLRMNRATFNKLCSMLRTFGKLSDSPHVTVEEMTAMFVHILAHHVKNRVIINKFTRSGETISRHFNSVLKGIIRLQSHLLKNPVAVTENSTDSRWKWFKNCLGALDGTYIRMHVLEEDKPRYRTRKGDIATNVLGVCSQDMQFIFVYPGWEGSAADSRILRDAVSRRHGLKIPRGYYYLVDAGYPKW